MSYKTKIRDINAISIDQEFIDSVLGDTNKEELEKLCLVYYLHGYVDGLQKIADDFKDGLKLRDIEEAIEDAKLITKNNDK